MTPEAVLSHPARVLTQEQRESYFSNGYLAVEALFDADEVERICAVVGEFVEKSRSESHSGTVFDLAPGHCADAPRIRRLRRPHEQHELFWETATGVLADVTADLVGPDVVFHHSKLNFKWNDGHDQVDWHQDIQFYPHTNYSPLTIGLLLRDTAFEDGAVGFLPGTHAGELFDQYNDQGQWTGCLNARDVEKLDLGSAVYIEAPAGSITVHNCRTVHGSPPSTRGGRASAAAECVCIGGCVPLHPASGAGAARGGGDPRQARPLGASRPASLPHSPGLVGRLHLDLRGPGRRRRVRRRPGFPAWAEPPRGAARCAGCGGADTRRFWRVRRRYGPTAEP